MLRAADLGAQAVGFCGGGAAAAGDGRQARDRGGGGGADGAEENVGLLQDALFRLGHHLRSVFLDDGGELPCAPARSALQQHSHFRLGSTACMIPVGAMSMFAFPRHGSLERPSAIALAF